MAVAALVCAVSAGLLWSANINNEGKIADVSAGVLAGASIWLTLAWIIWEVIL